MSPVLPADVDAWLDGELDAGRAADVSRAVAADPELARVAEVHRAVRQRLSRLRAPTQDFRAAVLGQIGGDPTRRGPRRLEAWGLGLAALAVLWLAWPTPAPPVSGSSPAALKMVSAPPEARAVPDAVVPQVARPPRTIPVEVPLEVPAPQEVAIPAPAGLAPMPPADVVLSWHVSNPEDVWMAHRLAGRLGGYVSVPLVEEDLADAHARLVLAIPPDALAVLVTDMGQFGHVVRTQGDGLVGDGNVLVQVDVTVGTTD